MRVRSHGQAEPVQVLVSKCSTGDRLAADLAGCGLGVMRSESVAATRCLNIEHEQRLSPFAWLRMARAARLLHGWPAMSEALDVARAESNGGEGGSTFARHRAQRRKTARLPGRSSPRRRTRPQASEGWRRGWDSNPRAAYATRRFRGAPVTTTSVPLRGTECAAIHCSRAPPIRQPVTGQCAILAGSGAWKIGADRFALSGGVTIRFQRGKRRTP